MTANIKFFSMIYFDGKVKVLFFTVGPPGSTPANPNGPTEAGIPESLQGLNEDQLMIGKVAPFWIPDSEAANCMICDAKFTMVRRRHHCRGCGHVLCSICCSDKFSLSYMDGKEGRVCKPCKNILERLAKAENASVTEGQRTSRPNPANPMEYCSTIPPHQQVAAEGATATPPSVMVPVGVLKRPDAANSGEGRPNSDPKSVRLILNFLGLFLFPFMFGNVLLFHSFPYLVFSMLILQWIA